MTRVEELARFVASRSFRHLSKTSVAQLKIRILDALGCAIGALNGPPVKLLKGLETEFGGASLCTLIGGGKTAPDRAAFYNGALVRYLDFNDSFLAKGETCHPSDNVAPVLAAAEYGDASGKDFLVALGVAYQVQCRLSQVAPVRSKGFDHVTQGAYAVAAGASRALSLEAAKTANAIAISGTALNALRVTRTGKLSNWKGFAYPFVSFGAIHAVFLAKEGITGPLEVFEGNKGFMDSISGQFELDWSKDNLDLVTKTILKKFNAEIHSQSAIECILRLRSDGLRAENVDSVEVRIFDVAYNIIGGGEEGEKKSVRTKEEADHSLPYILAAALIDGEVTPEQYTAERISSDDVQTLLRRINVRADKEYSSKFPNAMPCEVTVHTKDGRSLRESTIDYEGFFTRPMTWERALQKFQTLASSYAEANLRLEIQAAIANLESVNTRELAKLLQKVKGPMHEETRQSYIRKLTT
jgi:2-methylcitrate dehydratase